MRAAGRPLTYTVGLPDASTPPWHTGPQQCIAQASSTRCQPRPLTNTLSLASMLGRLGKQPWPVQVS